MSKSDCINLFSTIIESASTLGLFVLAWIAYVKYIQPDTLKNLHKELRKSLTDEFYINYVVISSDMEDEIVNTVYGNRDNFNKKRITDFTSHCFAHIQRQSSILDVMRDKRDVYGLDMESEYCGEPSKITPINKVLNTVDALLEELRGQWDTNKKNIEKSIQTNKLNYTISYDVKKIQGLYNKFLKEKRKLPYGKFGIIAMWFNYVWSKIYNYIEARINY